MDWKSLTRLFVALVVVSEASFAEEVSVYGPEKPPAMAREKTPDESVLTLNAAIQRAMANSPRLKSAGSARGIAAGEREQARALPNPAVSVQAENFAVGGEFRGLDSAEITYGVSELVEVSGKRSARIAAADKGILLSELEVDSARLNLVRDVTVAYANAVSADERVSLAKEQRELASEVLKAVTKRVDAAADPLYQKNKAEVAESMSGIALDKAERDAGVAKQNLAALWGESDASFRLDARDFFTITEPPSLGILNVLVKQNPDFLRWDIEREQKSAALSFAKAGAIPDPSINLGVRDLRGSGTQALVAGVSLPLPVFDQNSGNIAKARADVQKAENDGIDARVRLTADLGRNWQEWNNAYRTAKSFVEEIIPSAEQSFKLARHGYGIGKFPYLEVLDAQRTLFESRQQYFEVLKEYHIARAEVERITAANKNNLEEGQ
jgi:outer membrane protein, heavy metal efflux system